jgi:uncharacterized repeat protein (TIGR02543 family)
MDKHDSESNYRPQGNFISYWAPDTVYENSIAIDSDQIQYYTMNGGYPGLDYAGGFTFAKPGEHRQNQSFLGSIALNVAKRGIHYAGGVEGVQHIKDTVVYDTTGGGIAYGQQGGELASVNVEHSTIGKVTTYEQWLQGGMGVGVISGGFTSSEIKNSLITNVYKGVTDYISSDYNDFYGNAMNYGAYIGGNIAPQPGAHDMYVDPKLKYLPRVESDSPLKGKASDGGDIGANILYQYGVSGTLYGEPGYDRLTNTPLWPFPYEDEIKKDMAAYQYGSLSGKRGFAKDGTGLYGGPITLTSYIWEYLGYPCPSNICTSSGITPSTANLYTTATNGAVNRSPNSTTYNYGAQVTLTATPNTGFTFTGWSGDATGITNPLQVTMYSDKSITANFSPSTPVTCITNPATQVPISTLYNISSITNPTSISNFTITTRDGKTRILFKQALNLVRNAGGCYSPVAIDSAVISRTAYAKIDSQNYPELNKPATLTFSDITFQNPVIRKDGAICTACTIISYDKTTHVLTVDVPGFSEYTVAEGTVSPVCANGILEFTEQCDDSNTTAGDGCNTTCQTESNYTCSGSPSVCQVIPPPPPAGGGGSGGGTVATDFNSMTQEQKIAYLLAKIAELRAQIAAILAQRGFGSSIPSTFTFNTTLVLGTNSNDVLYLQKLLNQDPATRIAATGFGSPGQETIHFGPATKQAVIRFQEKYASEILYPAYQTGTGIVGKATRKKLNSLLGR